MSDWIHIKDQKPEEDRELFYFFEVLGIYRGKYVASTYPVEEFGTDEDGNPYTIDTFYSGKGFLGDDVTHWMYADGFDEDEMPEPPEDYVRVFDGHFKGYTHKDNAIVVRMDEFEALQDSVNYAREGHLYGLVCQDGCPCHIYWNEEDDGYVCGGCGTVYDTEDCETNPSKYRESTYDPKRD